MISVYIHIPFCNAKCDYCDFFSIPVKGRKAPEEEYLHALTRQLKTDVDRLELADRGINSIYIGGGTPSLLSEEFYEKLLWAIGTTFVMQSDMEISCEVNPATARGEWFRRMVAAGVNRFSIGVQSFQDDKLKALGRIHSAKDAQRAIAEAQDAGAHSVNVDLMYGVPGQKLADVEGDLKTAMTFQPQHLSAYQLTLEPGTPMEKARLPRETTVLKQLRLVRRMLESGGWKPYEISNFAKPSCMCQHNLHYWRYGEYLGLGCGATSFIVRPAGTTKRSSYGVRWTMTRDIKRYLKGRFEFEESDHVSLRTAMGEFCFLGLRTSEGISLDAFERRFGRPFSKTFPGVVEGLSKKELVTVDGDSVVLTQKGVELSNAVFEQFVE